jgi:DNA-directed RNA polymerase specialized sigma24 family protein
MPPAENRSSPFPVTRWSLVAHVGQPADEESRLRALSDLCALYWYPLYGFARGRGASAADAEDQTQGFFATILSTDLFAKATAERGKLRSFLLGSFSHYMANLHRADQRLKRGGGQQILAIDVAIAEDRLSQEAASDQSIEMLYEKRWALALVSAAMAAVEADYRRRDKPGHFQALRPFLEGTDDDQSYAQAAEMLGFTVTAARQEVYRMRIKFRDQMRAAIADTLAVPTHEAVEAELEELKRVLAA